MHASGCTERYRELMKQLLCLRRVLWLFSGAVDFGCGSVWLFPGMVKKQRKPSAAEPLHRNFETDSNTT